MRCLIALSLMAVSVFGQGAPARPEAVPKAVPRTAAVPRPAAGSLPVGAWKNLKFGKLGEVKIPAVEVYTLKNGIKVFLLENHALPFISGSALVRTGSLLDPKGKVGLSEIEATVLRTGGTKSKPGDQIDEQMENIAASVESGMDDNIATVSFSCLKENIDEVLGVYFDVLANPEFRQDKIDLIKTQFRSAISRRYDDADDVNRSEFKSLVYGKDNPFGWDVEYADLNAVTRQDLVDFHKRYYYPGNIMLTVQGDFDTSSMKARLDQVLGGWNPPPGQKAVFPKVSYQAKPGIYLGEKKDVTQTFLSMGHLGGILSDKDYPALEVMSDLLGGSFDSRLFRKVRTELGYAYGIGGGWGAGYLEPGLFRIGASTKTETTVATIQAILGEIEKLRTQPVSDEELETAKEKVVNSFVFNFDRPSKTLSRLVRYEYYGYPKDFLAQYQKAIAAVTKADILRVAKQYIDPSKFVIVTVGNPDEFKTPLTDLKLPVTKLDLTVKDEKPATSQADPASLAKGKQLLTRMQQSVGGAENLAGVKDLSSTASGMLGNMSVKQKSLLLLPDKLRQEQTLPFGVLTVMFDGTKGVVTAPNAPGPQPMPPPILRQVREELFRTLPSLLLSDRIAGRTVNAVSDSEVEIADGDGNLARLAMDAASGLPSKLSYQAEGRQGKVAVELRYKDFRETGGIKLPFALEILQGGQKSGETKYETIAVNSGVKIEEIMKQ